VSDDAPLSEGERLRAAIRSENELAMTEAAFDGLKIAMVNALIGSDYEESQKREHLYHALRAMTDVREALKATVRFGTDAKAIAEAAEQMAAAMGAKQ
jgi:hypothetical protein